MTSLWKQRGARSGGGSCALLLVLSWCGAACAPSTGVAQVFDFSDASVGGTSNGGASSGGTSPGGTGSSSGSGGTQATGGISGSGGTIGNTGGTQSTGGTTTAAVFDAGSDPNRNTVQAGKVCDRLATVQCAGEAFCCANPGRTFDQCYQTQLSACQSVYLDDITLNPISGYDINKAQAAFTEFEALASQCDPGVAAWAISWTGLRGIVAGTIPPGGNCTSTNLLNQALDAAYLASCTNGDTTACLPNATFSQWSCAARAGAGSSCMTDVNCLDGVYCNKPNLTSLGTCAARKSNGASCGGANECSSLMCKGGVCVVADKQAAYCLAN